MAVSSKAFGKERKIQRQPEMDNSSSATEPCALCLPRRENWYQNITMTIAFREEYPSDFHLCIIIVMIIYSFYIILIYNSHNI